jgi:hypothetical protein
VKHTREYAEFARNLRLSTNKDVALNRAQGVVWALLFKDESFEKILLDGYQEKIVYLPFKISAN